ncbi:MAG: type III pantothenate kinase [Bythopirellula sp.]|nr:type III pantothenate kinase [Bythopirellula sp.]
MSAANRAGLLAIDVGTSRVKLGWFPDAVPCDSEKPSQLPIATPHLPQPTEMFACSHREQSKLEFAEQLASWLGQFVDDKPQAVVASVNPQAAMAVAETLKLCGFAAPRVLRTEDLPIQVAVNEPARVGIDRVLAAVAVNRIRSADKPAIVVSLGTACTVNLISADGTFEGGAILPGLAMAGQALHTGTSSLPLITPENLEHRKNAIGKNTAEAMSAGIYWGLVGAIEKMIREQSRALAAEPQLFLTGGDAPLVVEALSASFGSVRLMPHLVLTGIAIACEAPT